MIMPMTTLGIALLSPGEVGWWLFQILLHPLNQNHERRSALPCSNLLDFAASKFSLSRPHIISEVKARLTLRYQTK
jgi:hypothetical protein